MKAGGGATDCIFSHIYMNCRLHNKILQVTQLLIIVMIVAWANVPILNIFFDHLQSMIRYSSAKFHAMFTDSSLKNAPMVNMKKA